MLLNIIRVVVLAVAILLWLISFFLLYLCIHFANLPYNEEGNYFDGEVTWHEGDSVVYGFFFVVVLLFSGLLTAIFFGIKNRKISKIKKQDGRSFGVPQDDISISMS